VTIACTHNSHHFTSIVTNTKMKNIKHHLPLLLIAVRVALFKLCGAPTPPTPAVSHSNSALFCESLYELCTRFSPSQLHSISLSHNPYSIFSHTFELLLLPFVVSFAGSLKPNSDSTPLQLPSKGHFGLHTSHAFATWLGLPHLTVLKITPNCKNNTKNEMKPESNTQT